MSANDVAADVEALALTVGDASLTGHVYIGGNDACLAVAEVVLASDWLAGVVATARAEARLAAFDAVEKELTPFATRGSQYSPQWAYHALDRARAAREDGAR